MTQLPRGARAIMGQRHEPPDSLDFFPTPPWGTRALFERVLSSPSQVTSAWDPFAGHGHMERVMAEYCDNVHGSDIFDYVGRYQVLDFLDELQPAPNRQWIIGNPPYGDNIIPMLLRALHLQRRLSRKLFGYAYVAMLMPTIKIAGQTRYSEIYERFPLRTYAPFAERLPMVKGNYNPDASTATDYAWYIWAFRQGWATGERQLKIIEPCRSVLEKADDPLNFNASCRVPEPDDLRKQSAKRLQAKRKETLCLL